MPVYTRLMNIAATVSREDWLRKAANNKDNNNSTVVYVESSLTDRLRAVSLFSWTVEQNVRDTQTTTRVTKGARLPPSFLAFRGFAAQRSGHQATGSLRKDQQRVGIPPTTLVRPHASVINYVAADLKDPLKNKTTSTDTKIDSKGTDSCVCIVEMSIMW